jgi:hypothetical protein
VRERESPRFWAGGGDGADNHSSIQRLWRPWQARQALEYSGSFIELGKPSICCSPASAWAWVQLVCSAAISGDANLTARLPDAIEHYLQAVRR